MMGPKKEKGGMVSIIIEKMKDHYGKGKESNEDFMEGKHDEEHKDSEVYEKYKEEVGRNVQSHGRKRQRYVLRMSQDVHQKMC